MLEAVRRWAEELAAGHPGVLRIGCFGSYARETWGVGSDVDIVVVVETSDEPFLRRPLAFDATTLPVPADLLVYTVDEWNDPAAGPGGRASSLDPVWVYPPA